LNVIIEEARHRRSEHPRVTQLPEPLSPSYRSQSPNWNTATGADMSTMNRDRTALERARKGHDGCDRFGKAR
jgi:hypothetical protein